MTTVKIPLRFIINISVHKTLFGLLQVAAVASLTDFELEFRMRVLREISCSWKIRLSLLILEVFSGFAHGAVTCQKYFRQKHEGRIKVTDFKPYSMWVMVKMNNKSIKVSTHYLDDRREFVVSSEVLRRE